MTVSTPFADRPATPYWDPWNPAPPSYYGEGMGDASDVVGNVTGDVTEVFRTLYSNQPGMYTQQMADGSVITYRQPTGSQVSLPVGSIGGQFGANLNTNVGSGFGMWALVGIGAFLFFMSRGK